MELDFFSTIGFYDYTFLVSVQLYLLLKATKSNPRSKRIDKNATTKQESDTNATKPGPINDKKATVVLHVT